MALPPNTDEHAWEIKMEWTKCVWMKVGKAVFFRGGWDCVGNVGEGPWRYWISNQYLLQGPRPWALSFEVMALTSKWMTCSLENGWTWWKYDGVWDDLGCLDANPSGWKTLQAKSLGLVTVFGFVWFWVWDWVMVLRCQSLGLHSCLWCFATTC